MGAGLAMRSICKACVSKRSMATFSGGLPLLSRTHRRRAAQGQQAAQRRHTNTERMRRHTTDDHGRAMHPSAPYAAPQNPAPLVMRRQTPLVMRCYVSSGPQWCETRLPCRAYEYLAVGQFGSASNS